MAPSAKTYWIKLYYFWLEKVQKVQTQVSSHSNQFLMNAPDILLKCNVFLKVKAS